MAQSFRVANLLGKTGTFSNSLTISGNPVVTGVDLSSYITTGQTGTFYPASNPSGYINFIGVLINSGIQVLGFSNASGSSINLGQLNTVYSASTSTPATVIGYSSTSSGSSSFAVGNTAKALNSSAIAIGPSTLASASFALAIGDTSIASGGASISIGRAATCYSSYSTAIQNGASASGNQSIAIGRNATTTNDNTIAIGYNSSAKGTGAVALGNGASAINNNTIVLGAAGYQIGIANSTPQYTLDVSGSGNFTSGLYVSGNSVLTGENLFISNSGTYATTGYVTGVSGYLKGLIPSNVVSGLTITGLTSSGTLTLSGLGSVSLTSSGQYIYISGSSTSVSNAVYTNVANQTISGNLTVTGSFSANTKSFLIDHPTISGKKLQYGVLEGPEHSVYLRGKTNNDFINFPHYWSGLIDQNSVTVSLTPIGKHQKLFVEYINVSGVKVGKHYFDDINYYYHIFAERKDISKLEVEF